jgi:hypothetical protein
MFDRRWLGAGLALVLVAAACSGDDGDAADDLVPYFEQVEQVTVHLDESNQGLPETTDIESARAFFSAVNPASVIALGELSSLVPPEAAQESHDRLIELRGEYLALNQRIAERLDTIVTAEEFAALASDEELGIQPQNALGAEVEAACRNLQAVADGEAIDVSLRCDITG